MSKTATFFSTLLVGCLPLWNLLLLPGAAKPGITAADENATLPPCTDSVELSYSFQISDPAGGIDSVDVFFDGGGSGLSFSSFQVDPGGTTAYGQASGWVSEGLFTLTLGYAGETVQAQLNVISTPDTEAPTLVFPAAGLLAQASACEGQTAALAFSLSASDNCDPDPALSAVLSPAGATLIPLGSSSDFLLIGSPGAYQLLISATDASGNTRQENVPVTIEVDSPEPANLGCNDTLNLTQTPDCAFPLTADLLLEGSFGCLTAADFDIQVADADPTNGPVLDGTGYFTYEVNPQLPGPTQGLADLLDPNQWSQAGTPNASVQFSADAIEMEVPYESGSRQAVFWTIPRDGMLEFAWSLDDLPAAAALSILLAEPGGATSLLVQDSTSAGTLELNVQAGQVLILILESFEDLSGQAVATLSAWTYEPVGLPGFSSCQGVLLAEDQSPPELVCPPDTENGILLQPQQGFSGTLSDADPTFVPAGALCLSPAPAGDFSFDTLSFQVGQTGTYLLEMIADWGVGRAALFQGEFYPAQPCPNFLTSGEPVADGTGLFPSAAQPIRLSAPLLAGKTYTLLTTTQTAGQTGSYQWGIYGGPGNIAGLPVQTDTVLVNLLCGDEEQIFQQDASLAFTGTPGLQDNCSSAQVHFSDQLAAQGDCGEATLTRTFFAMDAAGNAISCNQQIGIRKLAVDDVQLPPPNLFLECTDAYPLDANNNPHPSATGYPVVLSLQGVQTIDPALCNLSASYNDGPLVAFCFGAVGFTRQWVVVDECEPGTSLLYEQQIKIGDVLGPTVACPAEGLEVFTDKEECAASFEVPLPEVNDNCSDWEVLTEIVTDQWVPVTDSFGEVVDSLVETVVLATLPPGAPSRLVEGIPAGCHRIRYTVTDDCDNQTVQECAFCVIDDKEPSAACDEFLNVSLDGDGLAQLTAEQINEGSWDNCGIAELQIRRVFSTDPFNCEPVTPAFGPYGAAVPLSCCDAGDTVRVELLVTDLNGNANHCWAEVLVEDKGRPNCKPPEPVDLSCADLPDDLNLHDTLLLNDLFGRASAFDNCGAFIRELPALDQRSDCGEGAIIRRFLAQDESGNTSLGVCSQLISLSGLRNYEIRFPEDATGFCGEAEPDSVFLNEIGCDLLAVSMSSDTFIVFETECVKIERTFRVINWCTYDGQSDAILIGRDEDGNGIKGDQPVWVLRRQDSAFIDSDPDETNGFFREVTPNGLWEYKQQIKVIDTIPPELTASTPEPFCITTADGCMAEIDYFVTVLENCTPSFVEVEVGVDSGNNGIIDTILGDDNILGRAPKFRFNAEFPEGQYELVVTLTDGCGNTSTYELPFEVIDCKAPAPACISGWAIELMPLDEPADVNGDGMLDFFANTIQATDFVNSPPADCSPPVTYSINRVGETPHPDSTQLTVTCTDLGTLDVEVYAWDSAFNPNAVQPDGSLGGPNYDFCLTFLEVQSNLFPCDEPVLALGGLIATEVAQPVQDVQVQLSGLAPQTTFTDAGGIYSLDGLSPGQDYTIFPSLNTDLLNGVSTLDVILIQRHILNIEPLNSPYKRIAADINRSSTISTADLVLLRRAILGIDAEFEGNTSWQFVDAAFSFPDPDDPWATYFPELINLNDLSASNDGLDFVGVKVGDVNASAQASGGPGMQQRHVPAVQLRLPDLNFTAGENFSLPVYPPEGADWEGLQFGLRFSPEVFELADLEFGLAGEHQLGTAQLAEGHLSCSWDRYGRQAEAAPLFTLKLRTRRSGRLAEHLRLANAPLTPEAYDSELRPHPIALAFGEQVVQAELQLEAPRPNPFSGRTQLNCYLPTQAEASLRLRDSYGRPVRLIRFPEGSSGNHRLILTADELPAPGLYLIELEQGGERVVRKLIFLGR